MLLVVNILYGFYKIPDGILHALNMKYSARKPHMTEFIWCRKQHYGKHEANPTRFRKKRMGNREDFR